MYQKLDYSRFKTEINLTQYAAHLGYEIDKKKTTRSSVVMRSGGDKVIISRKGNVWGYFSVCDDSDNGTIIDFAEKRTNKTIGEIGKELNQWIGGSVNLPSPKSYIRDIEEQEFNPERVGQIFKQCRVAYKQAYLESRGITQALLTSERFKGRIYQNRYGNAVFPHYNEKGICGLELKNTDIAVFVKGSEKTLWRSNTKAGDDTFIISEAVIDGLSYASLFPNETAIYAATGGGMSPEQGAIVRAFVGKAAGIKKVIIITDNDEGGDRLTAKIEAAIAETEFQGEIKRHSPEPRGQDWNNILNPKL